MNNILEYRGKISKNNDLTELKGLKVGMWIVGNLVINEIQKKAWIWLDYKKQKQCLEVDFNSFDIEVGITLQKKGKRKNETLFAGDLILFHDDKKPFLVSYSAKDTGFIVTSQDENDTFCPIEYLHVMELNDCEIIGNRIDNSDLLS